MLKDAKIHFFAILWLLFWRKKVVFAGLNRYVIPVGARGKRHGVYVW
jgi:hypothetical protein